MGRKQIKSNEVDNLLDYETIVQIAPSLKDTLTKENAFDFSRQLYDFTKIIYELYKNEKKELNT
jgi:hypothetical protein